MNIKKWFLDLPIIRKLNFAFILLVFIPLMLLSIFANQVSSNLVIRKTVQHAEQNLQVVTQSLDSLFSYAENLSGIIVSNDIIQEATSMRKVMDDPQIFEYEYLIRDELDTVIQSKEVFDSVIINLENGLNFSSSYVDTNSLQNWSLEKEPFLNFFQENWGKVGYIETHKIEYHRESVDGYYISMVRPIISVITSDIVGKAEMNINQINISKIYQNIDYGEEALFFILNRNGEVVSSQNEDEILKNKKNEVYFSWLKQYNEEAKTFDINNKAFLVVKKDFERLDWTVVGIIPRKQLLTDLTKLTRLIYIIGLICMLLMIPFTLLFSNLIFKPLSLLTLTMVEAGKGDFEMEVDVNSRDEIGVLSENFNQMMRKISTLMDEVYVEQQNKRKYEILALNAQIKPHFLYNTLESACSLIQQNRKDESFKMIKALGLFYRTSLHGESQRILIRDELDHVRHYLTIQKIRYEDQFDYIIESEEEVERSSIVKMSIQPLVENSIYHGFRGSEKKGELIIRLNKKNNDICIWIIDNGRGFYVDDNNSILKKKEIKKGFGMKSVHERLKLYYGEKYGIKHIESSQNGTKIMILIPFLSTKEEI